MPVPDRGRTARARAEMSYVAVCASHNEEEFIAHSLRSVLSQTVPPKIVILSDDGSTDRTRLIAKKLGVTVVSEKRTRHKLRGINQVLALRAGIFMATELVSDWGYLLKFDADTIIPENYVEHLLKRMEKYPVLGICAGKPEKEGVRLARASDAAKVYRRDCWDAIGGLDIWIAFDSHAILKASQRGWATMTIPSITFRELRPSGKYSLTRCVLTGFERASFGVPLYHTILASIKNIKWGYPPILGSIATILAHIISPWPQDPSLDHEWIRSYAINEIRFFIGKLKGNAVRARRSKE